LVWGGVEEVWRRCGGGVEEVWRRCGGGVEEMWRRCGGGVEEVWRLGVDFAADFGEEGGLALEVAGEGLDGAEGGRADVVFHALDVVMDDLVVEAEELEEIGEEVVAVGDVAGEGFAGGGEDEAAIFFVFEEAFRVEALDHVGDAGLGDFEAGGDIDDAGVAF
jgi:hypothetical protein